METHTHALTPAQLTPPAEETKLCKNGLHALTSDNVYIDYRGSERCRACKRGRSARQGCRTPDCPHERGAQSPYCDPCRAVRGAASSPRQRHTRVCADCSIRQELSDFLLPKSARDGKRYGDVCTDCRTLDDVPADSPWEEAKRSVEDEYGVPFAEWYNRKEHPLNMLWLARAVRINNARPNAEFIKPGEVWTEENACRLLTQQGITPIRAAA